MTKGGGKLGPGLDLVGVLFVARCLPFPPCGGWPDEEATDAAKAAGVGGDYCFVEVELDAAQPAMGLHPGGGAPEFLGRLSGLLSKKGERSGVVFGLSGKVVGCWCSSWGGCSAPCLYCEKLLNLGLQRRNLLVGMICALLSLLGQLLRYVCCRRCCHDERERLWGGLGEGWKGKAGERWGREAGTGEKGGKQGGRKEEGLMKRRGTKEEEGKERKIIEIGGGREDWREKGREGRPKGKYGEKSVRRAEAGEKSGKRGVRVEEGLLKRRGRKEEGKREGEINEVEEGEREGEGKGKEGRRGKKGEKRERKRKVQEGVDPKPLVRE